MLLTVQMMNYLHSGRHRVGDYEGNVEAARVLVLVHKHLVPPGHGDARGREAAEWRTEWDVISTLKERGHELR